VESVSSCVYSFQFPQVDRAPFTVNNDEKGVNSFREIKAQ
jgi:hypothetical protein